MQEEGGKASAAVPGAAVAGAEGDAAGVCPPAARVTSSAGTLGTKARPPAPPPGGGSNLRRAVSGKAASVGAGAAVGVGVKAAPGEAASRDMLMGMVDTVRCQCSSLESDTAWHACGHDIDGRPQDLLAQQTLARGRRFGLWAGCRGKFRRVRLPTVAFTH